MELSHLILIFEEDHTDNIRGQSFVHRTSRKYPNARYIHKHTGKIPFKINKLYRATYSFK
jgi:hypothetical protein